MRVLGSPKATSEQLKIVGDTRTGFEVIRGAAGSGKTTTALLRLRNLSSMFAARYRRLGIEKPVNVLVLTFNRTLCGYVESLAREQASNIDNVLLEVETFARWAKQYCVDKVVSNEREELIAKAVATSGVKLPLEFVVSEVDYIMGRFEPRGNYAGYLDAERTGRGAVPRIDRDTRKSLLETVKKYRDELQNRGEVDWNDFALYALAGAAKKYEIVIIDEAQDFSANQIRAVLAHLTEMNAMTLVMDTVQRLYPRGYTWREVGIDPRQTRYYRLEQNHRNTVEIAQFASGIVRGIVVDDDGTLPNLDRATRRGPIPQIIKGLYRSQLDAAIEHIRSNVNLEEESVAFLKPLGGGWFDDVRLRLHKEHISFEEITRVRDWPENDTNVLLSTMHSAKGLEFDHVIIIGLNGEVTPHGHDDEDDRRVTLRRLMAMAVARARKTVLIGYKEEEASELVKYFDDGTFNEI